MLKLALIAGYKCGKVGRLDVRVIVLVFDYFCPGIVIVYERTKQHIRKDKIQFLSFSCLARLFTPMDRLATRFAPRQKKNTSSSSSWETGEWEL